ncbi:RTA1 like [Cordyceps militaris]|uniref:RTA1 like n=1 Tax=Cordyceps militaris TaxID=73501 RepID=A0A2H4SAP0_CORMI|nr:RTA1 like [Cordyceps militaris]
MTSTTSSFHTRPSDVFGANSPCHLDNCPVEWSIFGYRPSLAANAVFLALFVVIGTVHAYSGLRWRSWGFMTGMLLGCLCEVLGYVGRLLMWNNPFSYNGFMIQIICLTIAPVFFTASIYVTLSKTITYFAPELSRFKPQLFYWIFIPADVVCLILQAAGGALSTVMHDGKRTGVNISMAGLILQVVVMVLFIAAFADYMARLLRSGRARDKLRGWRTAIFFAGLAAACVFVLTRCAYRVAELKDGYAGKLFREESLFIVLESVMVVLAGVALLFGSPGMVFDKPAVRNGTWLGKHSNMVSEEGGFQMGEHNGKRYTGRADHV